MSSPTQEPDREPTLSDVNSRLSDVIDGLNGLSQQFNTLSEKVDKYDEKFEWYTQSTRQIVNLAFGLLATATVTIIVTTVLK